MEFDKKSMLSSNFMYKFHQKNDVDTYVSVCFKKDLYLGAHKYSLVPLEGENVWPEAEGDKYYHTLYKTAWKTKKKLEEDCRWSV